MLDLRRLTGSDRIVNIRNHNTEHLETKGLFTIYMDFAAHNSLEDLMAGYTAPHQDVDDDADDADGPYDENGWNAMGYGRNGLHKDGYPDGYDVHGYDKEGLDRQGRYYQDVIESDHGKGNPEEDGRDGDEDEEEDYGEEEYDEEGYGGEEYEEDQQEEDQQEENEHEEDEHEETGVPAEAEDHVAALGQQANYAPDEPKERDFLPEPFIWMVFDQLCTAGLLLQRGDLEPTTKTWPLMLHRDIRTPNVFLGTNTTGAFKGDPMIKLGDFGMCAIIPPGVSKGRDYYRYRTRHTPPVSLC